MNPWLETLGVVLVTLAGIYLGWVCSGFRKPYWLLGYLFSFTLIAMLILARQNGPLHSLPPLAWIAASRAKFIILALAVTTGLTTPLSRLPRKSERLLVCLVMAVVVGWFSVLPFIAPTLIRGRLSSLATKFDSDGVCRQATSYTCGPAAAVTALAKLGLSANEGEIAILAHCSPVTGTLPACLCAALADRYAGQGLKCRYGHFDSISQLKRAGVTIAIVRDAFLLDHCIAVLEVSDRTVTIADPMAGLRLMPREQFEKIWRFSGIILNRDG
ncbi:MAG: cysteine peptidase family C39 domain-containing protein [Sedimentisphaerales bacterium]|nr:cysteine peptidase family C39 domain-containing protein [Sedimentisphaerales bacterium]